MGLDASATKHQAVATKEQREEGVHQHLPGSLLPDEANVTNNASKDDVVVTDNDVCLYDGGDIQSDNPGNAFFLAEVKKVVDKYKSTDWNEKMHIVESLMRKVTEKKGRFLVGSKRKSKMAANPNAPSHKWLELLDMGCRRKVSSVLEHLTATPFDDAAASGPNDDGQVQRARDHFNDNLAEVVQAPIETPRVKRGSSDSSLGKAVRRTKQHHDDDATSAAFTALASASPALVNDLLGIIQLPTPSNQQFDRGPINSISSSALGRFSPFSFGSEADTHALACHLPKTLPVHAQPSRAQTESGNRSKTSPPMASTTTTKPAAKAAASTAVADGLSTTAIGKPAEANQVKQPSISAVAVPAATVANGSKRMSTDDCVSAVGEELLHIGKQNDDLFSDHVRRCLQIDALLDVPLVGISGHLVTRYERVGHPSRSTESPTVCLKWFVDLAGQNVKLAECAQEEERHVNELTNLNGRKKVNTTKVDADRARVPSRHCNAQTTPLSQRIAATANAQALSECDGDSRCLFEEWIGSAKDEALDIIHKNKDLSKTYRDLWITIVGFRPNIADRGNDIGEIAQPSPGKSASKQGWIDWVLELDEQNTYLQERIKKAETLLSAIEAVDVAKKQAEEKKQAALAAYHSS